MTRFRLPGTLASSFAWRLLAPSCVCLCLTWILGIFCGMAAMAAPMIGPGSASSSPGRGYILPPPPPGTVGVGPPPALPGLIPTPPSGSSTPSSGSSSSGSWSPRPRPAKATPLIKGGRPSSLGYDPNDFTDKLSMQEGMTIVFPIYEGLDTRWMKIGDYDFIAHIEEVNESGYAFSWSMSYPAQAKGFRATNADDVKNSDCVSLFYPNNDMGTLVGCTNIVRISDRLYSNIKKGVAVPFELDGPEVSLRLHHEIRPVPHAIEGIGTESLPVLVNSEQVFVRAIKCATDNGWNYWILDNPNFPIMLKGDGPFHWTQPSFSMALAALPGIGGGTPGGSSASTDEGKKVIRDLESKGKATTYAILFDFDKDTLRPQSKAVLKDIGLYLKRKPQVKLYVEGHTDIIGGMDYNLDLSHRRAESVRRFLITNYSIDPARLIAKGYGYTVPIAENTTPHGRQLNRRVVFKKF